MSGNRRRTRRGTGIRGRGDGWRIIIGRRSTLSYQHPDVHEIAADSNWLVVSGVDGGVDGGRDSRVTNSRPPLASYGSRSSWRELADWLR